MFSRNQAIRTLYLYNGIFVFAGGLFGPLYAVFVQSLGASPFLVSFSWVVFLASSTIFVILLARTKLANRDKEHLLMAGYLLRAIVWVMFIFVGSIYSLIILQVLLGLGEALGTPAFESLFAERLDRGRSIQEYSSLKVIFNISGGVATLIGGITATIFGFAALFLVMATLALISFLGILLTRSRSAPAAILVEHGEHKYQAE